jgi:DHA2 family methylenomycin A resistance protein-like MFS transporter
MTKIFPIGHLCNFSMITGIYTEFSHRNHQRNFETHHIRKVVSMSASFPLYPRITLAAAALGFVVVLLDVSVVNVALDALRTRFSTDVAGLQWVVNAYTLVFAALLLMAGALGDRLGARAIFITGFVLFTLASLGCGLAPTLASLVAARLAQGVGAALLVPNALGLVAQAFPDKEQRSRAVGWWGAAGGIALAAGPVAGGFLVTHFGWRSVFLINIPVGLLGLALVLRYSKPSPRNEGRSLDLPGQAAAISALASLAIALTNAAHLGWTHPRILVALIVAILSAIGFILIEARSHAPMLPLSVFSSSAFSIASITGVIVNFAYYGLIFVFSLFFQLEQHLSPQETGIAFLPMTIVLMVMNIIAGRLITRLGVRRLMVFGLLLAATGYLLLIPVSVGGAYWQLIVPMLMAASGIALMVPTMTNVTLSSVDPSRAGVASGVLNTARQVGGMLGVATCGYFVRDTVPSAFMHGMHLSLIVAVVLLFLGAALSFFCLNREV